MRFRSASMVCRGALSSSWELRWLAFFCLCMVLVNSQDTSTAAPAPSPPKKSISTNKSSICALEFEQFAKPLDLIRVTPEHNPLALAHTAALYPRILCFMYTTSTWHETRVQAVVDTWGQRCHKLVVFSNEAHEFVPSRVDLRTGQPVLTKPDQAQAFSRAYAQAHGLGNVSSNIEVVTLDAPVDADHLWQRHRAGLRYIFQHFRQDFDWFYKANDESYVILENLREYLKRSDILTKWKQQPMQLGRRVDLTKDKIDALVKGKSFEKDFHDQFRSVTFNSGDAGYAMNGLFLDQLIKALDDKTCFADAESSQTITEDVATSFCMMWHSVTPWDTRDVSGRERWHTVNPSEVFENDTGGLRGGKDDCAPDSIAFYHMTPERMHHMERQLYFCRSSRHELDDFNQQYSLAISNRVLVSPLAVEA